MESIAFETSHEFVQTANGVQNAFQILGDIVFAVLQSCVCNKQSLAMHAVIFKASVCVTSIPATFKRGGCRAAHFPLLEVNTDRCTLRLVLYRTYRDSTTAQVNLNGFLD
ncbi:unnamed protein product [Periconia digitata]|uniref:Uncharacterized protein n=1 Tax=Periconia digitata TaxID=1303443 RepID=A0A9W4XNC4_9PLEO|nr:unnamed protein product [Periconia digitata]